MKVLFIGDIHGRDDWIEIANDALLKFQKVVFIGDYVDSFNIRPVLIKRNLEGIIGFKIQHSDNVTLLLGNHDYAYIHGKFNTSGYTHTVAHDYKYIFQEFKDLFDVAWGYENHVTKKYTLATHAGLTYTYYNNYILPSLQDHKSMLYKLIDGNINTPLHQILNYLINTDIIWKVGSMRGGMGTPGPLWADYLELLDDPYPEINQVFGHTASGTVSVDQFGDFFIAKVDGNIKGGTGTGHLTLDI